MSSFLKAGVPLTKIDSFSGVFEDRGYRLACWRMMSDNIPFIRSHEISLIEDEMARKNVGIIYLTGQCISEKYLLLLHGL